MQQPLATGRPPASAFRSGSEHTFPATPLGRVAARRMLPELRRCGDTDRADRIEMWLLAAEITWQHPRTTHVRRVVGPDSVGVTAVELDGGRQVAAGWYSHDRPELIEQDRGSLGRLARIAAVQAGVFEQIEQPDGQLGDPEFGRDDRVWPALAECVAADIDRLAGRADPDGHIS